MNFGFIIDNRKCIGCHACTVACKAEHDVAIGVNRTWVKYIEKGEFPHTRRLFSVMRCNHCEDAPCVEICPVTALFKRDDGIVDFDNRRCIGCKGCMQACPYDALYIDPNSHTAAKCNYCAHRIDIGLEPACVNVCPEHAIISGDMDDPFSEISQLLAREQVTARKVEKGTRPKLFYIEGDEASLKPIVTAQESNYMWSSQAAGVGHFAHYAEARMSQADPAKMAELLKGRDGDGQSGRVGEWVSGRAGDEEAVWVPHNGDEKKIRQKAQDVIREKARRVYDAPGKGVLWGWEVSAYVWTKAISTGAWLVLFIALFVVAPLGANPEGAIAKVQWLGLALGLIFLTLTGALLVKDLDQPLRFAYVLLRPQWGSWLVRGGYIIAMYGGLLTLWGLAKYFDWSGVQSFALWGSAIFAVLTAVYTAFLFAQAKGRDFWQSPALPLHMLVHAFMAGAAVFAIIAQFSPAAQEWSNYLRLVLYGSIAFNLVVITIELMTTHPTEDAKATVRMIVSGRFRKLFWLGTIILGNFAPLPLLWLGAPILFGLAGVLVLIGIYITEHIWVRAPQLIPLS
ncbi:MAG: polysulfide reductase NrfD [candidate division KSB1 bacterium]|nr:polysulfide reductase NrfD [candidate division KSB1 bacterium]MDZ7367585.1 polysulfide reductase NrfD [candidate division KSB1 bacterium]MDZ7405377.1 polysulfide reductase NrfD [candidate division KSB1 bacterium]